MHTAIQGRYFMHATVHYGYISVLICMQVLAMYDVYSHFVLLLCVFFSVPHACKEM